MVGPKECHNLLTGRDIIQNGPRRHRNKRLFLIYVLERMSDHHGEFSFVMNFRTVLGQDDGFTGPNHGAGRFEKIQRNRRDFVAKFVGVKSKASGQTDNFRWKHGRKRTGPEEFRPRHWLDYLAPPSGTTPSGGILQVHSVTEACCETDWS